MVASNLRHANQADGATPTVTAAIFLANNVERRSTASCRGVRQLQACAYGTVRTSRVLAGNAMGAAYRDAATLTNAINKVGDENNGKNNRSATISAVWLVTEANRRRPQHKQAYCVVGVAQCVYTNLLYRGGVAGDVCSAIALLTWKTATLGVTAISCS